MSKSSAVRQGEAASAAEGALAAATAEIEACLAHAGDDGVSDETLRRGFSALTQLYARKAEGRQSIFPLEPSAGASATAVLMTSTALLKGANLELFELGMWQSWSGMK